MQNAHVPSQPAASETTATPAPDAGEPTEEGAADTVTLDQFEMLKVLGKGTFGKVMLGKHTDGSLYAIKILKKDVILAKVRHMPIAPFSLSFRMKLRTP